MDDVIKAILDIDNQAQMIENDINEMKEQSGKEIEEEVKKLEAELSKKAKDKIEQIKKTEAEDQKVQIENMETAIWEQLKKLDNVYSENKDKWVSEIVHRICGDEHA